MFILIYLKNLTIVIVERVKELLCYYGYGYDITTINLFEMINYSNMNTKCLGLDTYDIHFI